LEGDLTLEMVLALRDLVAEVGGGHGGRVAMALDLSFLLPCFMR
jgi:hypothetical protein